MKYFSTVLVLFLAVAMIGSAFAKVDVQVLPAKKQAKQFEAAVASSPNPQNIVYSLRGDSSLWLEDFENGAPGWFSVDETLAPAYWHQDSWNAYGGSGLSWWMADTTNGFNGYLSHWYQVMDTPDITLSGSPVLTFYHRLKCEDPAGATPPYDGWDGVNVRISTDGGATWTVLQNPTPAYTATSLYSFGFEFGEGPNVPGWAGDLSTWTQVTVDLSAYSGQTVRIRFAFASDPAYDTSSDPTMFGWQVDEIKVADGTNVLYYNDGSQTDVTVASNAPVGGDYWHIATDPGAPSPTHIADATDPSTGTYHENMIDSYISPYFWLPDTLNEMYLDFYMSGTFTDPDQWPNVDYFGAYVQVKGEDVWRYVSNITMDPNGSNYVYSSAPDFFALFSESYSVGLVDLMPLAGDSIRVKFTFFSDDDTPQGTALRVDDVIVWSPDLSPTPPPAPQNLQATAGDGFVDLVWDDLNVAGSQKFIYDDGTFENAIHLNSGTADAGVYFNSVAASAIDTIWVYGYSAITTNTTTLKIWEALGGVINATPAYTKTINIQPNVWNAIDLTGDNWTVAGDFVAGIEINVDMWIALDQNTIPSAHSWVNLGGWQTWQAVAAANGLPDGEWGVRAKVSYAGATNITYNVYRRLEVDPTYTAPIATGLTTAAYHDATVTNGETYCYVVTGVYPGQGESNYSNEVCGITPQAATVYELGYDDGSAESNYNPGAGNYIAVKFDPQHYPQDLIKLRYYFDNGPGTSQFIVFDDDGANGMPGTALATINVNNITAGWNDVELSAPITITEGAFYVGLRFTPSAINLGIDDTPPIDNMSYLRIGATGTWENFSTLGLGDAMIRCLLDSANVGIKDIDPQMITDFQLLQNYPNPFNPNTQISFLVPASMTGERVTLKVFDILGREVTTLVNGNLTPGLHQVEWNGTNSAGQAVTSGIYFYTIKAGEKIQTRKMMLMK
ncbi:MAG: hypothetical protein Kow0037_15520 [Calditrichia bacterium]